MIQFNTWILIAAFVLISAVSVLLTKVGANQLGNITIGSWLNLKSLFSIVFNKFVVISFSLALITRFLFLWASSKAALFEINAASALGFIAIPVAAIVFLGESMTVVQWIGTVLIAVGVFLVAK